MIEGFIRGLSWGYLRVTLGFYRGYIGRMARKWKLLFRDQGFVGLISWLDTFNNILPLHALGAFEKGGISPKYEKPFSQKSTEP